MRLLNGRTVGAAAGGTVPAARVYHNAAQSIANNTLTYLAFNSERFDTDTMHDNTTNNSRLTCNTAGIYHIWCNIAFASDADGSRHIYLVVNHSGTAIAFSYQKATGYVRMQCSAPYALEVGDYVEIAVLHDAGAALDVVAAGNYSPEFSMVKVG